MNSAQHQFIQTLVQGAQDSRAALHPLAQDCLGLILLAAIIILCLVWLWIVSGGFARYLAPGSGPERKAIEDWFADSRKGT